eukprot:374010_1
MIRSVTFEYIEKALWVSWGLDTGDGCDSKKLLYVFAQVLMKGEPLSMHVGVRGELGATGKELWDMFFALLSGDDLEYGYDVETKIKIECYGQNNRIGWNADEEEEVKNECNESKYVKKMKKLKNLGVKFGMDPRKVIKSTTLNEFIRLQTGGVIPSILSRLQQAEDADDVLIVSNRLQFIQDEIEAYNQRTDDVIEFDPFFTESFVYDTILNHYINEYRTNYTNMELYRKCCDLFVFSKMKEDANAQINHAFTLLQSVCERFEPDISYLEITAEYSIMIRSIYAANNNVKGIEYYAYWCQKFQLEAFRTENSNIYSLLYLLFVILYSNSTVEKHVHISNSIRDIKRNLLSLVLLDCILFIKYNGPDLSKCDPLLECGIDLWSKLGGLSALAEFSARSVPTCITNIMNYYKCTDPESRKPSEYQLNKKRREKRTKQTNQLLELLSFSLP